MYGQIALEKFELSEGPSVLLTSITSISGLQGGITPASADEIIVLDEDWSGRQSAQMSNYLRRCAMERKGAGMPNLVRIISQGTIEETLFGEVASSSSHYFDHEDDDGLRIDYTGHLLSKAAPLSASGTHALARIICALRGKPIDEVLKLGADDREDGKDSSDPPASSRSLFLPTLDEPKSNESVNRALGGQLSVLEGRACPLSSTYEQNYGGRSAAAADADRRSSGRVGAGDDQESLFFSFNGGCTYRSDGSVDCGGLLDALNFNCGSSHAAEHVPPCTVVASPNATTFPPFAVSRVDAPDMNLRKFVSSIYRDGVDEGGEEDEESLKLYYKKVSESWTALGLGCSSEQQATKLLTYPITPNPVRTNGSCKQLYAQSFLSFISSDQIKDGSLGMEPGIYAPPQIPGVLPLAYADAAWAADAARGEIYKNAADALRGELNKKKHKSGGGGDAQGGVVTPPGGYGMIGDGHLLSAHEAAKVAAKVPTATASYRQGSGGAEYGGNDGYLNSVLLYVKKYHGGDKKNARKKKEGVMDEEMISRYAIEGELPEETEARVRAEARKIRLQKQQKVASVIARNSALRSQAGPGVPLLFQQQPSHKGNFTKPDIYLRGMVKPLPLQEGASTGDGDLAKNLIQRKNMRRNATPPGPKVYFGPFGSGFFNCAGGQSGVQPPRPVTGISLPMGVNLRQQERDMSGDPWGKAEDAELEEATKRYGFNWHISSWCATAASKREAIATERRRSARQCVERWQELAQRNPALAAGIKEKDRLFQEMEGVEISQVPRALGEIMSRREGGSIIGDEELDNNDDTDLATGKDGKDGRRRQDADGSGENDKDKDDVKNKDMDGSSEKGEGQTEQAVGAASEEDDDSCRKVVLGRLAFLRQAASKRRKPPGIPGCQDPQLPLAQPHASHSTASRAAAKITSASGAVQEDKALMGDLWPLDVMNALKPRVNVHLKHRTARELKEQRNRQDQLLLRAKNMATDAAASAAAAAAAEKMQAN